MVVHKFECSNEHVFYMPLYFPINILEFVKIGDEMVCPTCQSEKISIYGQKYTVK